MSKARELAELSRTVADSADAVAITINSDEEVTFASDIDVTGSVTATGTSVFASLDISGDIDVDGTTNLDAVDIDGAVDMASTLQVDGVATFTATPVFSSDITVSDDIFLTSDSAAIKFGNGQEVTLTHTNDVGLTLNSTNRFMFRDSAIYLSSTSDGQLTVVADTEIELNATTIDINGNILASGTLGVTGVLTATSLDISGDIDVDGVTNLDVVDIDGAVDMASTLTVATKTTTNELELTAIAQSKSETAVDVFVYDTSKDSDGGAWRHRTQGTSWYNEALNTSTRGATKKFPSVAVIVAESGKVTIYDGDDPDMPMWMVFTQDTLGNLILAFGSTSNRPAHSVAMLDGTLVVSEKGSSGCLYKISMVADTSQWITENTQYGGFFRGDISTRNDGSGSTKYRYLAPTGTFNTIVSSLCNDIAMTVLPNAPIDADTGLPVPTIAVATAGGVSVIKDDGSVVNTGMTYGTSKVVFSVKDNSYIYFTYTGDHTLRSANIHTGSFISIGQSYNSNNDVLVVAPNSGWTGVQKLEAAKDFVATKAGNYLSFFTVPNDADTTTKDKGAVAYITSDYNTGWMNGDIKLATLMDTTAETISAPNIGLEAQSASGWTPFGSNTVEDDAGAVKITYASHQAGAYARFRASEASSVDLEIGQTYIISFDVKTTGTISGVVLYDHDGSPTDVNITGSLSNTSYESYHYSFTYVGSDHPYLGLTGFGSGDVVWIKDLVLIESVPDRSVNGNGLQVFGTVTKTAVATGADLVAYSGFSSSNYLQQPYNSDLDFGTGDFSCAVWAKLNSTGTRCVYHRGSGYSGSWGAEIIQLECTTTNLSFNFSDNGFNTSTQANTPIANLPTGVWNLIHTIRRGTTFELWINGVLKATNTSTMDLSNTAAKLWVGERPNGSRPWVGSLGLMRWSATAPTAEQVAKMYRDEKPLFQEGAQATLYGTSDSVTAIAYDDDTELLHAGTSAGRSVFQGLRRVDNTTDAVGAAISASNDLVVEE